MLYFVAVFAYLAAGCFIWGVLERLRNHNKKSGTLIFISGISLLLFVVLSFVDQKEIFCHAASPLMALLGLFAIVITAAGWITSTYSKG